jgi:hypothetical protein
MRKDMSKVIVERPRIIDTIPRKGRVVDPDLLPSKLGMRRSVRERGGEKMLNENLGPLRRYLLRQAGRPWNKVFSEISADLRATNTVQQHVRDHIEDFVELRPELRWRVVHGLYGKPERRLDGWLQPLYVDPRDGILKRTDSTQWRKVELARRKAKRSPPSDLVPVSSRAELRKVGGMWFEVTLAKLPEPEYRAVRRTIRVPLRPYYLSSPMREIEVTVHQLITGAVQDAVTGRLVLAGPEVDEDKAWQAYRRENPTRTYASAKRQLNRTELRRHGLQNDRSA